MNQARVESSTVLSRPFHGCPPIAIGGLVGRMKSSLACLAAWVVFTTILGPACVGPSPSAVSDGVVAPDPQAHGRAVAPSPRISSEAEAELQARLAALEHYVLSPAELARIEAQNADPNAVIPGEPWTGEMGVSVTVAQIMQWEAEAEAARGEGPAVRFSKPELEVPWRRDRPQAPGAINESQWPPAGTSSGGSHSDADLRGGGPAQSVGVSFNGLTITQSLEVIPPDSTGDIGPSQYVVCTNGRIRAYDKTGGLSGLDTSITVFFSSVRNGSGVSDPRVRFDRTSNRWFVTAINLQIPSRVMIAVSDGPTISSTSSFTFFFFVHDQVGSTPNSDTNGLFDYPSLGVDANALYIGGNIFAPSFTGTTGHVVRKSSLLAGGPIVVTAFRQLATSFGAGPFAPQGVSNDDTAATQGFFIGPDNSVFSRLVLRRVSNPGGSPSISGNLNILVPTTSFPSSVPVLGSTRPLDALDDRIFQGTIFKNDVTGNRTLWAAQNIRVSTAGIGTNTGNRVAVRWYELENLSATPSLGQVGTVFDSAASNFDRFWMPTIAMSRQGHAVMGCSVGGDARRAEIAFTGRLESDPQGTMSDPVIAQSTLFNYNVQTSGVQRWGDYSATSVDPSDGMTIWTAQEYTNLTNSWAVRVIELLAPPPATPSSAAPSTVDQGATGVNVVVTGTSSNGSGFFDPDASFPNHIAATVDGGGVTVNSVTFTDPTTISLNIDVDAGAATGARTITVTNPDGQQAASAGGILTVVPACALLGDLNEDTLINGGDIENFVDCLVTGTSSGNCACGDFDLANMVDLNDVPPFIVALGL